MSFDEEYMKDLVNKVIKKEREEQRLKVEQLKKKLKKQYGYIPKLVYEVFGRKKQ